jgi:hypothetical protein
MREVRYTARFKRDYRREKSGRHSKRLNALRTRIDSHFWDHGLVFTASNNSLNKAHVRWLESALVSRAVQAKRCILDNSTRYVRSDLNVLDGHPLRVSEHEQRPHAVVCAASDADDGPQFPVRLPIHRLSLNATRAPGRVPVASVAITLRLRGALVLYSAASFSV